jgi:hypothetical protein
MDTDGRKLRGISIPASTQIIRREYYLAQFFD